MISNKIKCNVFSSCWVNFEKNSAAFNYVPVVGLGVLAVIINEAASYDEKPILPMTDKSQRLSAQ